MIDQIYKIHHSGLILLLLGFLVFGCTTIQPVIKGKQPVEPPIFSNERFDRVLQQFVDERGVVFFSD